MASARVPDEGETTELARLRESEAGYRRLFELSSQPMWVYDLETLRFLTVNDAAVARYGWSREEFLGLTLRDIRPPEDVPALELNVRAVTEGLDHAGAWRHRLKDGRIIEVEITSHTVEFAGRRAELVLAVDVGENRRTQERLRWLQRAVEQTESAIFITGPDGVITYVNPGFEKLYGYTSEEALGQTPRILKSGEMSEEHYQGLWHTLLSGRNYHGTHVNRARDGRIVVVDASTTPLRGPDEQIVGYVSIQHDVSERRQLEEKRERLEEQLAHVQRFEALGTLAMGMAHDFNNLLGVVLGHAALLAQHPDDPVRVARAAEVLRLSGERAASMVRRVLTFARRSDARFEVVDSWATVTEVERMLRDILPRNISIELSGQPGQAFVWADRGQLEQVLLNLCLNARDAMPEGGTLALRVARLPGSRVRSRHEDAAAPEYVEMSVTDTGTGMSEETRRRVFEPFFTTKERGQGSGLGLSVVYGIVLAHGGQVDVESAEGRGTVFRVDLPACLSKATASRAPESRAAADATVLVVEDEPMLADLVRAWLQDAGYTVLMAHDGDEAMKRIAAHPGRLEAVLCDMGLPKRSGREVFFAVHEQDPQLPVILSSGSLDPAERVLLARSGVAGFLEKPYDQAQLLHAVRQVSSRADA